MAKPFIKMKKFIIFIVIVVLFVGGLGIYLNKSNFGPGKYDAFAQALSERGAKFYGAFWCPHCQAQKAEFGSAKKYLPYVECSTPNNQVTQICLDKKIEGYPTWTFQDGIKISAVGEPLVCPVLVEGVNPTGACQYSSSKYFKVWLFPGYKFSIKSPADPVKTDNVWQFPADAQAVGEIPQNFLAEQIGFTLPQ